MTKKLYDLAVRVGEYTNHNGETKGKYLNIGTVLQKDGGGKFMLLNRTFNPAGVINLDNKDSVIISMFKPKSENDNPVPEDGSSQKPPTSSDEIPF